MKIKLLAVLSSVTVLVFGLCSTVYADGYVTVNMRYPLVGTNYFGFTLQQSSFENQAFTEYRRPNYVTSTSNYGVYEFKLPEAYVDDGVGTANIGIILGIAKFNTTEYLQNHTFWVDPFSFTYQFDRLGAFTHYRITLRRFVQEVGGGVIVGSSEWLRAGNASTYGKINVPTTKVPITNEYIVPNGVDGGLAVCIDFQFSAPIQGSETTIYMRFNVLNNVVVSNYATQANPNIPTYNPPANQDKVTENQYLENEVLEGVEGLDLENNSSTLFDSIGTSIATFSNGLNFARVSINLFLEDIPWFRDFVQVSLALGITATLLGLAGSIIGSATRRKGGKD